MLGHEIIHVTEKHTIRAIQKSQAVQMGAAETLSGNSALMQRAVTATYDNIVDRGFGRADENEADEKGVALANKTGYAPNGLVAFLTTLKDRNKASTEKRGLFASHPEMQERLDRITKQIASQKLLATATVQPRYAKNISFKPVDPTAIATVEAGAAGLTGGGAKAEEKPEEKKAEEPEEGPLRAEQDAADQRRREEAGAGDRVRRRSRSRSREGFEGRPESGDRRGEDRRG